MARLWLLPALFLPALCGAQITGTFSLDKPTFALGEPVFLTLTLSNQGKEPEAIATADPYAACSGLHIEISRTDAPHRACAASFAVSCLSSGAVLAPHQTYTERILLNYPDHGQGDLNPPVHLPGDYTVDAVRIVNHAPPGPLATLYTNGAKTEIRQRLELRVDGSQAVSPAAYALFVQQLSSSDWRTRTEAARVLATFAPPSLEPLLLTFATSKDSFIQQFAPLALFNLSTDASLAALAEMLLHTEPGTYESMSAADYLGQTHDPKWMPLLLAFSDQHQGMSLGSAAKSGGDAAIPALLARLHATDPAVRSSAIFALGSTGSRAAVPLPISLLKPPSVAADQDAANEAASAQAALQQLTHLDLPEQPESHRVEATYHRWQHWWLTSGKTAQVYKPEECVEDTELP